jgi:uncharacterized peroxidase-related enzyme
VSWIRTIPYEEATGRLRQLYDKVKGPGDKVDNILMAHSLRPHTLEGHMAIYKYVLHHSCNRIPKWFLETIGVLVSLMNKCDYCVEHHFAGLKRLLGDDARAERMRAALERGDFEEAGLEERQKAALRYAAALTRAPDQIGEGMIRELRDAGFDDGEILEINQVTAYFAYANRTVLGLGCTTKGDILGLSPGNSDNPDDWSHR